MKNKIQNNLTIEESKLEEPVYEGLYGLYKITEDDQITVQRYRQSLLICGIAFSAGLGHWLIIGPALAWSWLIPIAISLGLALKWIHIYIRVLHMTLQLLWFLGCSGLVILIIKFGSNNVLPILTSNPIWLLAIGPLFAALTGLGFKEFFCFRRIEAIGLAILVPTALLGHLFKFIDGSLVMTLLALASLSLLVLSIRKFGIDPAADIGDKSVFEYLNNQKTKAIL